MARSNFRRASSCLFALAVAVITPAQYKQTNLVSDGFLPAAHIDPNLVNPWGMAFSNNGPFWIADNGKSVSTVYNSSGTPFPLGSPLVVNVLPVGESAPDGMAFNPGTGFNITGGGGTAPAVFIFVTEGGQIE